MTCLIKIFLKEGFFNSSHSARAKRVGELFPRILSRVLDELGFDVCTNSVQENGVDLKVYRDNSLILVIEVLNWSIWSRLNLKRKNKIAENLNQFQCKKLLLYTVPLAGITSFREIGIDTYNIGYQVLPRDFYNFFLERDNAYLRKPYSLQVKEDIKQQVLRYLEANQLIS